MEIIRLSNQNYLWSSIFEFQVLHELQDQVQLHLAAAKYLENIFEYKNKKKFKNYAFNDLEAGDSILNLPGVPTGNEQPEVENPIVPRLSAAVTESNTWSSSKRLFPSSAAADNTKYNC